MAPASRAGGVNRAWWVPASPLLVRCWHIGGTCHRVGTAHVTIPHAEIGGWRTDVAKQLEHPRPIRHRLLVSVAFHAVFRVGRGEQEARRLPSDKDGSRYSNTLQPFARTGLQAIDSSRNG